MNERPKKIPAQEHDSDSERLLRPQPQDRGEGYRAAGKLDGKVAIVTGGDSGIGRSVCIHFAKEGADIAFLYLKEHADAEETQRLIEASGRGALSVAGDIGIKENCRDFVRQVVERFGRLDVLVNNAGEQHVSQDFTEIDEAQVERTFRTNVYGAFFMTQAALPHLPQDGAIINNCSVTAYRGSKHLVDYAATKGALVAFTRSLAQQLAGKGIRVNGVAPGPIWTPLIASTFSAEEVAKFGQNVPMKRPGQPDEVAPAFVFLASRDASYFTGQILHPNGGEIVNA